MIKKNGKELTIENRTNYNITYGTVNNKNPKAIYLTLSGWAEPLIDEELDYKKVIRQITKSIKGDLYNTLDPKLFNIDRTIIDFDMRESGIKFGKRSYMHCEITLYQINSFKIQEKVIKKNIDKIIENISNNVLNRVEYFDFYKRKK